MANTRSIESLIFRQAGALADLAFGIKSGPQNENGHNLALLSVADLDLDLTDPEQRAFGDYELLEKLGQGGMGVVYRARQSSLNREVALKLLAAGPWSSEDFIERFQKEAQSAARLQHPNIVTVFDIGDQDDLNFFTMQLVRGKTLGEYIESSDGALSPVESARIVRTVANAVDFAHRLGVLHLDIKPSNVLLDEQNEPMVADFGLAKQLGRFLDVENEEVSGTPSYMAPEQTTLGATRLSPSTDVYGIGALLFECLTGRPPVEGKTVVATLQKIQSDEILTPREHSEDVPKDLDEICAKCLRKNSIERYQSAHTLAQDLSNFLNHRPVSARPLHWYQKLMLWTKREPRAALASATAFLILLAGLATTSTQWFRAEENSFTIQNLLWDSRRDSARNLARDGNGFQAATVLLQNAREMVDLKYGNSGQDDLVSANLILDSAPVLVKRTQLPPGIKSIALSDDGKFLVSVHSDGVLRWYDGTTLANLGALHLGGALGVYAATTPKLVEFVAPRRVVVSVTNYEWLPQPSGAMVMVDLELGKLVVPPRLQEDLLKVSYSRDGATAVLRYGSGHPDDDSQQLWQLDPWRPLSTEVSASPLRHLPWMPLNGGKYTATTYATMQPVALWQGLEEVRATVGRPEAYAIASWRTNHAGTQVAVGDVGGRTWLLDAASGVVQALPGIAGDRVGWVSFSEDDKLLATGAEDGTVFVFDLTTNKAIGGSLSHEFPVFRVEVNSENQLLLVSGDQQTAIWRIPESSIYPRAAVRLEADPTPLAQPTNPHVAAWAPSLGLFVSAEANGWTNVWQLPVTKILQAKAARQIPEQLRFDGRLVADVEGHHVRIYDVDARSAVTAWKDLGQAPGFAEIANGTLLVSLGAQMKVFAVDQNSNALTLQDEFTLRGSPQRLLQSENGMWAAVSFGSTENGFFEEIVEVYNIDSGSLLASLPLPGPLREMTFSSSNEELFVLGTNPDRIDIFSSTDMEHKFRILADEDHSISAFALAGDDVVFTQFGVDRRIDTLMRWQRGSDTAFQVVEIGDISAHDIAAVGTQQLVLGASQDFLVDGQTSARLLDRPFTEQPVPSVAVSHDGSYFARASRNEIQIYNGEGRALATLLTVELPGHDTIAKMAFARNETALLVRSALGRIMKWDVTGNAILAKGIAVVQERTQRQMDPGFQVFEQDTDQSQSWVRESRPPLSPVAKHVAGHPIPLRAPDTDELLLDLTDYYSMSPHKINHENGDTLIDMSGFPLGVQKLDGVEYDIRGLVFAGTSMEHRPDDDSLHTHYKVNTVTVAINPRRLKGINILLYARLYEPSPESQEFASVVYEYADGSEARVPLMTQVHVPGWTNDDAPVPIGWLLTTVATYFWDGFQVPISNPFIENPNAQKVVSSIHIDWRDTTFMPVVFAITATPET